ncbi:YybH family protein [Variovorax boronicumulans]|uniref:YybH family protein n=1 Tax=Variovorax boronicumulans TaxID=436515 RepID=UPI001C581E3C
MVDRQDAELPMQLARESFARWADAFSAADVELLVRLYTENAMMYGSRPQLLRGHDAIRDYLGSFSALGPKQIRFQQVSAEWAGPCAVSAAADAVLRFGGGNTEVFMRFTHVLVDEQQAWKIACHHASPTPSS